MGFEQLKYSPPQQSPEKHKLISHSKQEDNFKKPLRSYQFGSSADHLVVYVFAQCSSSSNVKKKPLKALTGH